MLAIAFMASIEALESFAVPSLATDKGGDARPSEDEDWSVCVSEECEALLVDESGASPGGNAPPVGGDDS